MLTFNAIDFETSNSNHRSICQIGIVQVLNGRIKRQWKTLVNPKEHFSPSNIRIHGIDESAVSRSPTLPAIYTDLREQLSNSVLVSHTAFDRIALEHALEHKQLAQLPITWLDSSVIVRRVWPEYFGKSGWGLKNVAAVLKIPLEHHHDALADARAAAEITLKACAEMQWSLEDCLAAIKRPSRQRRSESCGAGRHCSSGGAKRSKRLDGNPDGPLHGEKVVFTGRLSSPRADLEDTMAKLGCDVATDVSKSVTLLVVGSYSQTIRKGRELSSKHRKAIRLIEEGAEIKILTEDDLASLISIAESQMSGSA